MSEVTLIINDEKVKAKQGETILEVARRVGIDIPTLCHNEKVAPYGACRLCTVEITSGNRSRLVASCVYPVEDGLIVKTETERVVKGRKMILEFLWARAPGITALRTYGEKYGITGVKSMQDYGLIDDKTTTKFEVDPTYCILCGLCVRYCAEVKKKYAVGFIDRGPERRIMFFPQIANECCPTCQECYQLCPTGLLQAQYKLVNMSHTA
ncbi:MAG: 2Fe-2S iron-sulfur cluster-binding protein [Dehalococcoidales bacterium]|nr:2Fe-2S iron-sulfur cluster-binding protein [Dehalococcoidales bacterium]